MRLSVRTGYLLRGDRRPARRWSEGLVCRLAEHRARQRHELEAGRHLRPIYMADVSHSLQLAEQQGAHLLRQLSFLNAKLTDEAWQVDSTLHAHPLLICSLRKGRQTTPLKEKESAPSRRCTARCRRLPAARSAAPQSPQCWAPAGRMNASQVGATLNAVWCTALPCNCDERGFCCIVGSSCRHQVRCSGTEQLIQVRQAHQFAAGHGSHLCCIHPPPRSLNGSLDTVPTMKQEAPV